MAIIANSTSFTRFLVIGSPPEGYRDSFIQSIRDGAFWDIESTDAERSIGWVEFDDFTLYEFDAPERVFRAELIILGLRQDKRSIPPTIRRLHLKRAEKKFTEATGRKVMSRAEREEMKESVEHELLKRMMPTPSVSEMIWNLEKGTVLLGATSQAVISEFIEIFQSTFGLDLRIAHPFALGPSLFEGLEEDQSWLELEPAIIAAPRVVVEENIDE